MPRAAVTSGPHHLELVECDEAIPGTGEAVVAVEAVGLCGTDLHLFDGSLEGGGYPMVQGHEFCGQVVRCSGDTAQGLDVGERVVIDPVISCGGCFPCRNGASNACVRMEALGVHRPGGLQEEVVVPVDRLHLVGDLDPTVAALTEPLSIALHAVERAGIRAGQQVLVLGAGPIGLGCVLAAIRCGAEVMAVDLHPSRLALARSLGAEESVVANDELRHTVQEWTEGDGPAVAIEATGVAAVAHDAFHLVAASGTVALVGVSHQQVSIDLRLFTRKELNVVGTRATRDFPGAVDLVRTNASLLSSLVSHRFPLDRVREAFELAMTEPGSTVKVMVTVGTRG